MPLVAAANSTPISPVGEHTLLGITVLIVDDSDPIRQVLKKVIRQTGIAIATCLESGDGAEVRFL